MLRREFGKALAGLVAGLVPGLAGIGSRRLWVRGEMVPVASPLGGVPCDPVTLVRFDVEPRFCRVWSIRPHACQIVGHTNAATFKGLPPGSCLMVGMDERWGADSSNGVVFRFGIGDPAALDRLFTRVDFAPLELEDA